MAYKHYGGQPLGSSFMRIKQPLLYYAMDASGYFAVDYFIQQYFHYRGSHWWAAYFQQLLLEVMGLDYPKKFGNAL